MLNDVILSVIILSVFIVSKIMLNVIILSAVILAVTALTFNQDRCCHLAICLQLILFHLQQKPLFIEQKHIFEHYQEVQTRNNLLIDIIFVMKSNLMTFSELPPTDLC